MIAITVLAFISMSTYKMIDSNMDTREEVSREDGELLQSSTAMNRMDSDFAQLYSPLFSSSMTTTKTNSSGLSAAYNRFSEGLANSAFAGFAKNGNLIPQFVSDDKSTISFFTQSNRRKFANSKESRFAWVKYKLRAMTPDPENPDDKSSGRYELIRQTITSDIYNNTLNWDEAKEQLLMKNIKELEFSFWDEKNKKFTTNLADLNELKSLPRALKVNIVWIDENQNEQKIDKTFRVMTPYFNTALDEQGAKSNKPTKTQTETQVQDESDEEEF